MKSTTPRIITSDAEDHALREEMKQQAIRHARETGHPLDLPPVEGEDGSLTWETVEEVKNGMSVTRRKRITD